MQKLLPLLLIAILCSCNKGTPIEKPKDDSQKINLPKRPNILWLVAEDLSPFLAAYGDSTAYTPNLNRLADQGVVYTHFFSPSGVCAPSRAAIATGMYPTSIGAGHMRTGSHTEVTGNPAYEAVPPPEIKMMSEILRMNGYYCTNNAKQDYQFKPPVTAWDESSLYAHWRNRAPNQPFFAVFNFEETHESGLFEPYGFRKSAKRHYRSGDRSYEIEHGRLPENETAIHVDINTDFKVPPYLPDNDIVRRDLWKMYNNIAEMDRQIGAILDQLEEDGLIESTIIFFYGDHGGPLPRHKRLLYDSGLNTPLIVRFPYQSNKGVTHDLVSFVDLAPTVLSLVGIKPSQTIQGNAFLGSYKEDSSRTYIHGAADRFDESTDTRRAVRDQRFKYIRNYRPSQSNYLPLSYRERIPTMQELLKLKDSKKLDSIQARWFTSTKPPEELYDCKSDPYELINLANNPNYGKKLQELRNEMDRWLSEINDHPDLDESELITNLWNGANSKPLTQDPEVIYNGSLIKLHCATEGASIGYRIIEENQDTTRVWQVYDHTIEIPEGSTLQIQSHRIGFAPSNIVNFRQSESIE